MFSNMNILMEILIILYISPWIINNLIGVKMKENFTN